MPGTTSLVYGRWRQGETVSKLATARDRVTEGGDIPQGGPDVIRPGREATRGKSRAHPINMVSYGKDQEPLVPPRTRGHPEAVASGPPSVARLLDILEF
jgi:hypothetical protein